MSGERVWRAVFFSRPY